MFAWLDAGTYLRSAALNLQPTLTKNCRRRTKTRGLRERCSRAGGKVARIASALPERVGGYARLITTINCGIIESRPPPWALRGRVHSGHDLLGAGLALSFDN